MNLVCHNSPAGFIDVAESFLLENEAANNLITVFYQAIGYKPVGETLYMLFELLPV
jgi:hypothetical protein